MPAMFLKLDSQLKNNQSKRALKIIDESEWCWMQTLFLLAC
jgi:hypothetical protein